MVKALVAKKKKSKVRFNSCGQLFSAVMTGLVFLSSKRTEKCYNEVKKEKIIYGIWIMEVQ